MDFILWQSNDVQLKACVCFADGSGQITKILNLEIASQKQLSSFGLGWTLASASTSDHENQTGQKRCEAGSHPVSEPAQLLGQFGPTPEIPYTKLDRFSALVAT